MFKKICLILSCALFLLGAQVLTAQSLQAAQADQATQNQYFANYLATVQGLDLEKAEDGQKAAKAFLVYLQKIIGQNQDLLFQHLDRTVLVAGKEQKKSAVIKDAKKIFTPELVQAVQKTTSTEDLLLRNMTEYAVGDGCLWFSFTDDKAEKPVIISINTAK